MRKKITILVLVVLIFSLLSTASWAQVSSSERDRVSNELLMKMARTYGPPRAVSHSEPLGQVFDSVVQHAKRRDLRYRISVIDNREVNAVTLPNGHVVFFTGLLRALPTKDRSPVAFVVAHEISHMEKNHIERKMNQAAVTGTIIGILINRSSSVVQLLGVVTNQLLSSGYSRDMEYEADRKALSLMKAAGYDPNGALTVFNVLGRLESKKQNTRVFPTHPKASDRSKSVQAWMKSQGITMKDPSSSPTEHAVDTSPIPTTTPMIRTGNNDENPDQPSFRPGEGKIRVPVVDYSDITLEQLKDGDYLYEWEGELERGIIERLGKNIEVTGNSRQVARLRTFEKSQSVVEKNRVQLVFLVEPQATFPAFWTYLDDEVIPGLKTSNRKFKTLGVAVKQNISNKRHIVIVLEN